ncbi:MAG: hypothetical protein IJ956_02720 [Akkermansia sp.]|nr:hypothetical protein [Akkermansia sp.]
MKTIDRTDLVPMDAPGDGWYHIESNEEHPAKREGGDIVQVLDNAAMQAIVAAGVPEEGIPIDADHRGVPGVAEVPDTAAAGWVRELALFDDGAGNMQLAGRIEWTPPGLELVAGRVYKHFSTVYRVDDEELAEPLGGNRYRPLVLLGLALTNNPNNRMGQRPITNSLGRVGEVRGTNYEVRSEEEAGMSPQEDFSAAEEVAGTKTTKNENQDMNELEDIKKALGLAPEATAADCVAAIESIKGEAAAAADSEAETLLNSEGLSDLPEEEKKEIKEGLVTNRGLAMMTIRAFKERKAQSAAAAEPQARYAKAGTPRTGAKSTGSTIINRAKEIQKAERAAGRTCSFWKAHGMAKNELNK